MESNKENAQGHFDEELLECLFDLHWRALWALSRGVTLEFLMTKYNALLNFTCFYLEARVMRGLGKEMWKRSG